MERNIGRKGAIILIVLTLLICSAYLFGVRLRQYNERHLLMIDSLAGHKFAVIDLVTGDTVASTEWGDRIAVEPDPHLNPGDVDTNTPANNGDLYREIKFVNTMPVRIPAYFTFGNRKYPWSSYVPLEDTIPSGIILGPDWDYHRDTIYKVAWFKYNVIDGSDIEAYCPANGCILLHTYFAPHLADYYKNIRQSVWYQLDQYGNKAELPGFLFYKHIGKSEIRVL